MYAVRPLMDNHGVYRELTLRYTTVDVVHCRDGTDECDRGITDFNRLRVSMPAVVVI